MQSPIMSARRRKRLTITQEGEMTIISLGNIEIWDGADLALIRDTLVEQVQDYRRTVLAVDMETVKYIPSGFFGMLSEWKDRGICISIKGVQENVAQMLWFQQFFLESAPGIYRLQDEPQFEMNAVFDDEPDEFQNQSALDERAEQQFADRDASLEQVSC